MTRVDDRHRQGSLPILWPEFASLPQRNAQRAEVTRADPGQESRRTGIPFPVRRIIRLRPEVSFPFDEDRAGPADGSERQAISRADAFDAWQGCQTFVELGD